jgi:uncharacterized OB-fold protein
MISPVKVWRRQKKVRALLGRTATVLTYTKVVVPPAAQKSFAPYFVVLVEFENGERAVGQLVETDTVSVGATVKSILRKVRAPSDDGVIAYGLKFKLFES